MRARARACRVRIGVADRKKILGTEAPLPSRLAITDARLGTGHSS